MSFLFLPAPPDVQGGVGGPGQPGKEGAKVAWFLCLVTAGALCWSVHGPCGFPWGFLSRQARPTPLPGGGSCPPPCPQLPSGRLAEQGDRGHPYPRWPVLRELRDLTSWRVSPLWPRLPEVPSPCVWGRSWTPGTTCSVSLPLRHVVQGVNVTTPADPATGLPQTNAFSHTTKWNQGFDSVTDHSCGH